MTLVVVASMGLAGGVASAGVNVWTSSGPDGGIVNALAVDPVTPATVYAGTNGGGVFKSVNGGGSWTAVSAGLTTPYVRVLAIDPFTPATVYVGTAASGVFKSVNGGGSWTAVNTGLTNLNVNVLAVDPHTPATVYAGTDRGRSVQERQRGWKLGRGQHRSDEPERLCRGDRSGHAGDGVRRDDQRALQERQRRGELDAALTAA